MTGKVTAGECFTVTSELIDHYYEDSAHNLTFKEKILFYPRIHRYFSD